MLELQPFATVDVPPGSSGPQSIPPIAALDGGRAAVIDLDGGEVIVVEPYIGGLQQHIPLETTPGPFMVNGDHDVLYGIAQRGDESNPAAAEIVAIALTGPRAGSEIAAVSVSILPYTEAGRTMLGDGRDGIIDRRTGEQLLPYVGTDGSPKGYDEAPPNYRLDENGIVTDMNGSGRWNLTIERDPNYRGMYDTEPPPAPIGYGRAIYWTALGPAADPTLDVSDPTLPVIAVLQADGTGAWYGIPDGWIVVASDLEGVVFARRLGDNIELATLPP